MQAVFNLDLGYSSEDDALLDWEQYAGNAPFVALGRSCDGRPHSLAIACRRDEPRPLLRPGLLALAVCALLAATAVVVSSPGPGCSLPGAGQLGC